MHAVNRSARALIVLYRRAVHCDGGRQACSPSHGGCARACDTFSRFLTLRLVSVMRMRCTY